MAIHGWLSPRRTLSWDDVLASDHLTPEFLVCKARFTQQRLMSLQPDIYEWIHKKYVGLDDVPFMTGFPLDPIRHLNGDISTLITQRYPCELLQDLGYTYRWLRESQRMDSKWMSLLGFSIKQWVSQLGMTVEDVKRDMSDADAWEVFGITRDAVLMSMGLHGCMAVQREMGGGAGGKRGVGC